jgi:glycosyltransferase involved in cell wall biosynthesis
MQKQKIKIALLVDWFAPGYKAGGPIQSSVNFCMAMKEEYEIYVITTDTDLNEREPYPSIKSDQWINFTPAVDTYYFSKANLSYGKILKVIKDINPDYIYLNHVFSLHFVIMPLLMKWAKQIRSTVVLCPRGALFESAMHHQNSYGKKIVFIRLFKLIGGFRQIRFHATNGKEEQMIRYYFSNQDILVADNFASSSQCDFLKIEKQRGVLKVIFIARILPIKNLLFALKILQQVKSKVNFTIVGPLEDQVYWKNCQEAMEHIPSNINVHYIGSRSNNEIDLLLKQNHLYILPTEGENFGHSIFESFLSGRPVLISDQTPWRDLIGEKIGWDLSLNEPAAFVRAIEIASEWGQDEFDEYSYLAWNFAKAFNARPEQKLSYKKIFR